MDIQELVQKNPSELHRLLAEKRRELRELRFKVHERQLNAVHKMKLVKRDIARILTVINGKRLAQAAK